MTKTIDVEGFGKVTIKRSEWTGRFALLLNGKPLAHFSKKQFFIRENVDGQETTYYFYIEGNSFKGFSLYETKNKRRYVILKPFPWYGYILSAIPFTMIMVLGNSTLLHPYGIYIVGGAIGGAIGGGCSAFSFYANSTFSKWYFKILVSIAAIAVAFLLCWLIGDAMVRALIAIEQALTSSQQ